MDILLGKVDFNYSELTVDYLMKKSGHSTGHELCHQAWLTLFPVVMLTYMLMIN